MNSTLLRLCPLFFLATTMLTSTAAPAQSPLPPEKVLVSNQRTAVTYAEFEAELARIPGDDQLEFLMDKTRLARLVENVLINKTLALEARERKLDLLPKAQAEISVQTDKILAKYRGLQVQKEAPKIDFLARARETYLAYPERTTLPERYEVWHALVNTKDRTPEQAKARAEDIRRRLLAGEAREALAQTLSDDPSAAQNKGALGARELSKFIPRFAEEVKKLKIGEVSPAFETSYGIHIAQLLGHIPAKRYSFDEAKLALVEEAEIQYLRSVWADYIERIQNDPKLFVDTQALDALRPKLPEIPKQLPPTPAAIEAVKAGTVK